MIPLALNIAVQEREITHYIGVPVTARFSEFGAPGGPNEAVPRVYQWLGEHQIAPLGGPLYVYRHIGKADEMVDLTVAVPVAEPVRPSDGLVLGSLPAGTYVVGRHVGAPDEIAASGSKVKEWADSKALRLDVLRDEDGELWTGHAEHFLTDPTEEADASKWVTELLFKTA
ncbi:GyrI-like domain-containing protein [Kocuria marina]|uniref:GyrI-like domain-containing protein n=1 Tax=Kocuria marina TaxID=223184 RepID=UPI001EE4B73B|nr:GyrI-like domain-containing protein [Kocuria indica]